MRSPVVILIPAYNPPITLPDLINQLQATGFSDIVVVNDGSHQSFNPIFHRVALIKGVVYLSHDVNQGKGAALRTGLSFIVQNFPHVIGVITADADGQHLPKDVLKITQRLIDHPHAVILGTRNLSRNIPFRSWLGNSLLRIMFKLVAKQSIYDIMSGLRGLPLSSIPQFLYLPGNRYEYEVYMTLSLKSLGLSVIEEPIDTVYINHNATSHYNPIIDSLKIYWLFITYGFNKKSIDEAIIHHHTVSLRNSIISSLKLHWVILRYTISSLITYGVDILLFIWLFNWWGNITLSILISRWVAGAIVNFVLNRLLVFRKNELIWAALFRYYILISVTGLISIGLISWITNATGIPTAYIKIMVDLSLFPLGFVLQKWWVFGLSSQKKNIDGERKI